MNIRASLLAIVALLSLLLVASSVEDVVSALRARRAGVTAAEINAISDALLDVATLMALERGEINTVINDPKAFTPDQRRGIFDRHMEADRQLGLAIERARSIELPNRQRILADIERGRADFAKLKADAQRFLADDDDPRRAAILNLWFPGMTKFIDETQQFRRELERRLPLTTGPLIALGFEAKNSLWVMSEYAGRERGLISGLLAARRLATSAEREQMAENRAVLMAAWRRIAPRAADLGPPFVSEIRAVEQGFLRDFQEVRDHALTAVSSGDNPSMSAGEWFRNATDAIELIIGAEHAASRVVGRLIGEQVADAERALQFDIAAVLLVVLASAGALWVVIMRISRPLAAITHVLDQLATGNLDIPIPARERHDEMGKIARAAEVFRERAMQLAEAQAAAEAATKAKAEFLAMMSHEIRTPMTACSACWTFSKARI